MESMEMNLFTTVSEAKSWIVENEKKGAICPCCGEIVKVYKRKLNSGQAYELLLLYRLTITGNNGEFYHHTKFSQTTSGEISKLVFWGLVEQMPKPLNEIKKKTSGYWRITEKGMSFVENKTTVKSHVYILLGELVRFSESETTIIQALGKKFRYDELMNE